jgi:hypothetical protein
VLVKGSFGNQMVNKVKHTEETTRVYNIKVDEFHTYYVEKLGVWVDDECNDRQQVTWRSAARPGLATKWTLGSI